jgi:hypothetical protein
MAHVSVAVPCRCDQCLIPHGTGAGPTEEGVCCWLTRLNRHLGDGPELLLARLTGAFRAPGLAGYEWPRWGAYPSRVAVIKTVSKLITNEPP